MNGVSAGDGFVLSWPNGFPVSAQRTSFVVQRFDAGGALQWMRSFPTSPGAHERALAFGRDTFIMTAGQLARLDETGTILWSRTIQAEGTSSALLLDANGRTHVLGTGQVAAYSPDGQALWERELSSLGISFAAGAAIGPVSDDGILLRATVSTSQRLWRIAPDGAILWEAPAPTGQAPMRDDRRSGPADVGVVAGTFSASWVASPGQTIHQVSLPIFNLGSSAAQAVEPDGGLSSVVPTTGVKVTRHGATGNFLWERTAALPSGASFRFGHLPADSTFRVVHVASGSGPAAVMITDVAESGSTERTTSLTAESINSLVVSSGTRAYVAVDPAPSASGQRILSLDIAGTNDFAVDVPPIPVGVTPIHSARGAVLADGDGVFLVNVQGRPNTDSVIRVDVGAGSRSMSLDVASQGTRLHVDGNRTYIESSNGSSAEFTALGDDGAEEWSFPTSLWPQSSVAQVNAANGGLWVAGEDGDGFHVLRVDEEGLPLWDEVVAGGRFADTPRLASLGDDLVLAGRINQGGSDRCRVARVAGDGSVLWDLTMSTTASSEYCDAVIESVAGNALVASAVQFPASGVLLRELDADGDTINSGQLDLGVVILSAQLQRFGGSTYAYGRYSDPPTDSAGNYVVRFDPTTLVPVFSSLLRLPAPVGSDEPHATVDAAGISLATITSDSDDLEEGPLLARWDHAGNRLFHGFELYRVADGFARPVTTMPLPGGSVGIAYGVVDPATGLPSIRISSAPQRIHSSDFE